MHTEAKIDSSTVSDMPEAPPPREPLDLEMSDLRWSAVCAIEDGDMAALEEVLEEGLDPNYSHPEAGPSVIDVARKQMSVEALTALIQRGAQLGGAQEVSDSVFVEHVCRTAVAAGASNLIEQLVRQGYAAALIQAVRHLDGMALDSADPRYGRGELVQGIIESMQAQVTIDTLALPEDLRPLS